MIKTLYQSNIKYLVVHCSDSPHRGDTAAAIHRWHIERGFDCIGYHKVILDCGEIQDGRQEYMQGAHVLGHNHESLGVCLMGEGNYSVSQKYSLFAILYEWRKKYPLAKVVGHNELDPRKTCPMTSIEKWNDCLWIDNDESKCK